jgi:hypothetical protein
MKKLLTSMVCAYDANHMKEQPIVSWKLSAKSVATSGSVHEIIVSGNTIASVKLRIKLVKLQLYITATL